MAILAQQVLVGNVGRVYDMREVGRDNTSVVDFSMAITARKKSGDEWVDAETYWITVTAWNKLAENVVKSFKSGDRVFVVGRTDMKPAYTNKNGEEVPARAILIADFAGHEISYNASESKRVSGGNRSEGRSDSSSRSSSGSSSGSSSSSSGPASSSRPPKVEPKEDNLFDDDDDFSFDDEPPF